MKIKLPSNTRLLSFIYTTIIFSFILVIIIGYYQEKKEIKQTIYDSFSSEMSYLVDNLNSNLNLLSKNLKSQYKYRVPHNQTDFSLATKNIILAFPFIESINYITPQQKIKYVSPLKKKNKEILGLPINLKAPKNAFKKALENKEIILSKPFELIQGPIGYSLMLPISQKDAAIEIAFDINDMFDINNHLRRNENIKIEVTDGESVAYQDKNFIKYKRKYRDYKVKKTYKLLGRELKVSGVPNKNFVQQVSLFWRDITYLVVAIFVILVAFILIIQYLKIRYQSKAQDVQQKLIKKLENAQETLKKQNEKLKKISQEDELTALCSRRYIMEILNKSFYDAQNNYHHLNICMIDIDNFKEINDTYGHLAGDRVLQKIANIINRYINEKGYAGRYGGDEFLLIFPNIELDEAKEIVEKIKTIISRTILKEWPEIQIYISGGVCAYKNQQSLDEYIAETDRLLYKAKQENTSCIKSSN